MTTLLESFYNMFKIINFTKYEMLVFLYLIAFYVFFSLINSAIIVSEEKKKEKKNELNILYGGFLIAFSLLWLIFLIVSIIYTYKYPKV